MFLIVKVLFLLPLLIGLFARLCERRQRMLINQLYSAMSISLRDCGKRQRMGPHSFRR